MASGVVARVLLSVIFFYHGLVPKILFLSDTEIQMIQAHGLGLPPEQIALIGGVAEVLLGLAILIWRTRVWPILIALAALVLLLIDVAVFSPGLLLEAFNPVTTNLAAIGLCVVVLLEQRPKGRISRSPA